MARLTIILIVVVCGLISSCRSEIQKSETVTEMPEKSIAVIKKELQEQGYQTFDYVDEKSGDTVIMQQYFIAFLKRGTLLSSRYESRKSAREGAEKRIARTNEFWWRCQ